MLTLRELCLDCVIIAVNSSFVPLQYGWYWGALGFEDAEDKLANRRDGSFLVRDSSDERYILSLSFRSLGGTHHTRIEHYKGDYDLIYKFLHINKINEMSCCLDVD